MSNPIVYETAAIDGPYYGDFYRRHHKYQKKPVVIEAVYYTGYNDYYIAKWSDGKVCVSPVLEPDLDNPKGCYLQIKTLEGIMIANPGDYIVRGIKGEYYPVRKDIFEEMYESYEEKP